LICSQFYIIKSFFNNKLKEDHPRRPTYYLKISAH
jgi:hypothetical protein